MYTTVKTTKIQYYTPKAAAFLALSNATFYTLLAYTTNSVMSKNYTILVCNSNTKKQFTISSTTKQTKLAFIFTAIAAIAKQKYKNSNKIIVTLFYTNNSSVILQHNNFYSSACSAAVNITNLVNYIK